MGAQFWVVQAFNGISYGALLFLVGSGLSLIFGVMRIVNLAHGAYFLWGGYIALSVIGATGSWALSLPAAALAVAAIGIAMERLFLRSEGFARLRTALIAAGLGVLGALAFAARWGAAAGGSLSVLVLLAVACAAIAYFLLARIPVLAIETDVLRQVLLAVASSTIAYYLRARIPVPATETDVLRQVLLTVGFAFLFQQAALDI